MKFVLVINLRLLVIISNSVVFIIAEHETFPANEYKMPAIAWIFFYIYIFFYFLIFFYFFFFFFLQGKFHANLI